MEPILTAHHLDPGMSKPDIVSVPATSWINLRSKLGEVHDYKLEDAVRQGCRVIFKSNWREILAEQWQEPERVVIKIDDPEKKAAMYRWLKEEQGKKYIARVSREELKFLAGAFMIPKKTPGEFRPVVNLKKFNTACEHMPFTLQGVREVRAMWQDMTHGATLDLKEAFNHLGISPEHQNFFGIVVEGVNGQLEFYKCVALPFGWSQSPYYYNLLSLEIKARLRTALPTSVAIAMYVDDIYVMGKSSQEAQQALETTKKMLEEMGVTVNTKKSMAEVQESVEYLGYVINLRDKTISINKQKVYNIRHVAARELQAVYTTKRRISKLLGKIQGSREALPWLNAMSCSMYRMLLLEQKAGWNTPIKIWGSCKPELRYWANLKRWQATSTPEKERTTVVAYSDASATGYGLRAMVTSQERKTVILHQEDTWRVGEMVQHSTARELRTVLQGLNQLATQIPRGCSIHWSSDCIAAVAVARRFRTRSSALFNIGKQIAYLVAKMQWRLFTHWVPREQIDDADQWSRTTQGRCSRSAQLTLESHYIQRIVAATSYLKASPASWQEVFRPDQDWVFSTYNVWPERALAFPPLMAVEKTIEKAYP